MLRLSLVKLTLKSEKDGAETQHAAAGEVAGVAQTESQSVPVAFFQPLRVVISLFGNL